MTDQEFFQYLKENCNMVFTIEQKEAVLTVEGPIALISCPGSGKTTVLVAKIAYMILCLNVNPGKILVTSFSKQSATDMEERFYSKFGEKIHEKIGFSTIHSFAFSVFRDYASKINMKYSIIEGYDSGITTKNSILSNLYKKYNKENISEDKLKELSGFISYIKNFMILYKDIDKYSKQFPIPNFKEIYKEYEQIKREYRPLSSDNDYNCDKKERVRLLDFDDMLSMCYHALTKNSEILLACRDKYDYFLIDEAQDNSKIQNAISRLISSPKHNVCIVGDFRQSIYSWRGAVVEELTNFKDYYVNGKMLFMNQNFRSTKSIVKTASEFIKSNHNDLNRNMVTENQQGDPIDFIVAKDEFKQLEYVIDEIKGKTNFKGISVIYRYNISAVPLIEKLAKEGIPFYIKDDSPLFFNHFITNDIISFFNLAENPGSVEYFEDIYYKMKSYVAKNDIQELYYNTPEIGQDMKAKTVFDRLASSASYESKKEKLIDFKYHFEMMARMAPKRAIEYIEKELNYKDYLKEYAKKFNYSIDTIDVMLSTLKVICSDLSSIRELKPKLSSLQFEIIKSKKNKGTNAITLTTAHSSKGLEWDEVFIIGCQNIPSIDSLEKAKNDDKKAMEEETRLMFVAITRARKKLHLIYPEFQNEKKVEPSKFYKKLARLAGNKARSSADIKKLNKIKSNEFKLSKGLLITHNKWGQGEILDIDGDIVTVKLDGGQVKRLSATACFENNLIK